LIQQTLRPRSVIAQVLAQQFFSGASDFLASLLQQVVANKSPRVPFGVAAQMPLPALDDFEQSIAVAPFAQRAPNLPRRASQAPHLARARLGKKRAHGLLQAPAPNTSVMNDFRIRVRAYLRRQRHELFHPFAEQPRQRAASGCGIGSFRKRGHSFAAAICRFDPLFAFPVHGIPLSLLSSPHRQRNLRAHAMRPYNSCDLAVRNSSYCSSDLRTQTKEKDLFGFVEMTSQHLRLSLRLLDSFFRALSHLLLMFLLRLLRALRGEHSALC